MDIRLKEVLDNIMVQKFQQVVLPESLKNAYENQINTNSNTIPISETSFVSSLEFIYDLKQNGYALSKELLNLYLNNEVDRLELSNLILNSINHDIFNIRGEVFFKDFPTYEYHTEAYNNHQLFHYHTVANNDVFTTYIPSFNVENVKSFKEELVDLSVSISESSYENYIKDNQLKVIKVTQDYTKGYQYMRNLINTKTSLSEDDINNLITLLGLVEVLPKEEVELLLPPMIERKETMAIVVATLIDLGYDLMAFRQYIRTSTDILRIIDVLGGGKGSLNTSIVLPKFNRKIRKSIMELLNSINPYIASEDMFRYHKIWKGLVRLIHPFEDRYKQFSQSQESFKLFVEGNKEHTFASKSKELEKKGEYKHLVKVLSSRPGELARKMDLILRKIDESERLFVLNQFKSVIGDVSSLILYQLLSHLKNVENNVRKVETNKGHFYREVKDGSIDTFSKYILEGIIKDELKLRYSNLESLGKVYLDPKLKQYNIPINQRTSSLSSTLVTRGSQITLNLKDVLRIFTYWKNADVSDSIVSRTTRIDLDLSASLFDENFNYKNRIGFFNQRGKGVTHSGDIVDAPNGANEFIDFDLKVLKESGIKYIMTYVNVFSGLTFKNFDCKSGWLNLTKDETTLDFYTTGEVKFKGEKIDNLIDINSNHNSCVPLVVDIEQGKLYWLDERMANVFNKQGSTIHDNTSSPDLLEKAVSDDYISIYDLLDMHIKYRNAIEVFDKDYADIIFEQSNENPLDLTSIMSEYF